MALEHRVGQAEADMASAEPEVAEEPEAAGAKAGSEVEPEARVWRWYRT